MSSVVDKDMMLELKLPRTEVVEPGENMKEWRNLDNQKLKQTGEGLHKPDSDFKMRSESMGSYNKTVDSMKDVVSKELRSYVKSTHDQYDINNHLKMVTSEKKEPTLCSLRMKECSKKWIGTVLSSMCEEDSNKFAEEEQTSPKETFAQNDQENLTKDLCEDTSVSRKEKQLKSVKEDQNMKIQTSYQTEKEMKTEKQVNEDNEIKDGKGEKESKEKAEKGEKDIDTQEIRSEEKSFERVLDGISEKLDVNDDKFLMEEMPDPIIMSQIIPAEKSLNKVVLNCLAQDARNNNFCFQNNIFSDSLTDKSQDRSEATSCQSIDVIEHDNENLFRTLESFKCESKVIPMSSFESVSFNGPSEDNSSDENDVSIEIANCTNGTDQTCFSELSQGCKITCLEDNTICEKSIEQEIKFSNRDENSNNIDCTPLEIKRDNGLSKDLKEVANKVSYKIKVLPNKKAAKKRRANKATKRRQRKSILKNCLKKKTKVHVIPFSKTGPDFWHDSCKYRGCSGGQNGHKGGGKGGSSPTNSYRSSGNGGSVGSRSGGPQRSQGSQSGDDGDDPDDINRGIKNLKAFPSCDQDPNKGKSPQKGEEAKQGRLHNTFGKVGHTDDGFDRSTSDSADAPPNLPSVRWDARTIQMRRERENILPNNRPGQQLFHTAPSAAVPGHNTDRVGMIPGAIPFSSTPTNDVDVSHDHAIISTTQLCEIIGHAALNNEVPAELFSKIDTCLRKAMHDLSYSQYDFHDNLDSDGASNLQSPNVPATTQNKTCASTFGNGECTACLIISGLLSHMTQESHNNNCPTCVQVLALMTQHAKTCVANRPHQRFTRFDLCYKICKKAGWNVGEIKCGSHTFSGKIHKYCDKVLGKCRKTSGKETGAGEAVAVGIGEMDMLASPGPLSSSRGTNSSIIYLTSSGPITHESQDPNNNVFLSSSSQQSDKEIMQFKFGDMNLKSTSVAGDMPVQNKAFTSTPVTEMSQVPHALPATLNSISSGVLSQEAAVAVPTMPGQGRKTHSNLVRKGSQRTPAIPQPIVEESPPEQRAQASKDDSSLYQLMRKRYLQGPKGTDPYDTQPTFGDKKGYDSLPQGLLHDQEQFISFGNRPVGVPGIGEVVCGNPKQLRLVARFWERKREDCERTGTIPPYQHREEGVLLSHSKEHFSILRTRYQKHQQWEKVAHLGNGMSGKCHLVMDLKTNFKFCCKKVHLLKFSEQEVSLWSEIKYPYIVKLYGAIRHGVKIYIFSEFIDGGSLAVCIEEQKRLGQRFSHWSAINYFQQLLKVLHYLQSKNILHEDIKADNILLRKDSSFIAVTDFGLSLRLCDPRELNGVEPRGSAAHWSPEKVTSQGHGFPSDLWAAVCVLMHMLSGDPPWMRRFAHSATTLRYIIYSKEPPLQDVPTSVQPIVRDLIKSGLVKDPEKRPSPSQLLQHEAFKIIDDVKPEVFFSVLVTHSQVIKPIPSDGETKSENSNHEANEDYQILYSADVPTGSDQGTDVLSSEDCLPVREKEDDKDKQEEKNSGVEAHTAIISDRMLLTNKEVQSSTPLSKSSINMGNNASRQLSGKAASAPHKVLQQSSSQEKTKYTQEMPDFSELLSGLVPQESKAFYSDVVPNGAEALSQSSAKQKNSLAFYRPQRESYQVPNITPQNDSNQVPNLSIFDTSISVETRNGNMQSATASADTFSLTSRAYAGQAHDIPHQAAAGMEASLRPSLSRNRGHDVSVITSMLSSSSDDYSSSDLFKDTERSDGNENPLLASTALDPQNTQQSKMRQPSSLNDLQMSPSYGQNGAVSLGSSLQQRKPNNLKLNVPPSPGHSSPSNTGLRMGNRQRQSGNQFETPSTGQLSSNSSKMGSSKSASSPWFQAGSAGNGIYHEQEKLLQQYTAEQESHSSSGSERIDYNPYYEPSETVEIGHRADPISGSEALSLLQENIIATPLAGYKLIIRDADSGKEVMSMRSMDQPITKKHLILEIKRSKKITSAYCHFLFHNMDGSLLRLDTPLNVQEILVKGVPEPQKGCLCEICRSRF